ncbi:helix-turn-helix domain-containing protein [Accumulibacter sp.]|uniref:helix-turn-helix domain-containing protein n=1 Tax=Accumulibacter sp. TaxID=2053492 RepID=UPI00338FEABC
MISPEIRQSVQTLHQQGLAVREISRLLKLSRNTIRRILRMPVLADAREPACPAPVRLWLPAAFARVRGATGSAFRRCCRRNWASIPATARSPDGSAKPVCARRPGARASMSLRRARRCSTIPRPIA